MINGTLLHAQSSIPSDGDGDGDADPSGSLRVLISDSLSALAPDSVQVFLDDQPVAASVSPLDDGKHQVTFTPSQILEPRPSVLSYGS